MVSISMECRKWVFNKMEIYKDNNNNRMDILITYNSNSNNNNMVNNKMDIWMEWKWSNIIPKMVISRVLWEKNTVIIIWMGKICRKGNRNNHSKIKIKMAIIIWILRLSYFFLLNNNQLIYWTCKIFNNWVKKFKA